MKRPVLKYCLSMLFCCLMAQISFSQARGEDKITFDFECKADLESVSFGGTAPEGYITIHHDYKPHAAFVAPHWTKGNPDLAPVGYVAGQKAQVAAIFDFACEKIAENKVFAKGTGPNGIEFEAQSLYFTGKKGNYAMKIAKTAFTANMVDYFAKFQIKWQVKIGDTGAWQDAGTSENPMYVPLSQLDGCNLDDSRVFYSTIHYACKPAMGLTDKTKITEKIWGTFVGLKVPRIDKPTKSAMLYWGTSNPLIPISVCRGTQGLLHYEDANCGEWAVFMQHCLAMHGFSDICLYNIDAKLITDFDEIVAFETAFTAYFGLNATLVSKDVVFLVKKWNVPNLKKFYYTGKKYIPVNPNYYTNYSGNLVLANGNTVPVGDILGDKAQGISDPEPLFTDHAVVTLANGKIYDPSYGTGLFADILDWEFKSVDAYAWEGLYTPDNGSMNIYSIIYPYEHEISSKQQVKYTKP